MGSKRLDAIRQARMKAKSRGAGIYSYVNQTVAERLGITEWKPEEGDNYIRVIPPKKDDEFWAKEIFIHSDVGVNGATFLCSRQMFGERCCICEDALRLRKRNPDDESLKVLRARRRWLMFVVDVKNKETEKKGLRFFDSPLGIVDDIVNLSEDRRTGKRIDVSDLEEGCDIGFVRSGTKMHNTDYSAVKFYSQDPVTEALLDCAETVPEWEDILKIVDFETLEKEYKGFDDEAEPSYEREERSREPVKENRILEEDTSKRTRTEEGRQKSDEDRDVKEATDEEKEDVRSTRRRRKVVREDEEDTSLEREASSRKEGSNLDAIRERLRKAKEGK